MGSFERIFRAEVEKRLSPTLEDSVVNEEGIEHLPEPVRKYLRFVGAVGKPTVHNFFAVVSGGMKRTTKSNWMDIKARQFNFFDPPARFFYIKSSLFGIPFIGLHVYASNGATMKMKIASLLQVVDAKGEEMNLSENVTLFNDMCLLAPATLIDKKIQWEMLDPLTVKGKFTNNNISITALLHFNENGELIDFTSDDRYLSIDGKTYTKYRWSTPVRNYRDFDGRKVPTDGEAIWHMPGVDFIYAKFRLEEIEYNSKRYK